MAWSSLDLAGHCLSDQARTDALIAALKTVLHSGDVVLDAGAGSGVLSLAATGMGASRVVAVEQNDFLCKLLQQECKRQEVTVDVICSDLHQLQLFRVDVVVAELIDVWLLEEEFAKAICQLRRAGIIEDRTRIIPSGYSFHAELGWCDWSTHRRGLLFPYYEWMAYQDQSWDVPRFECFIKWSNIERLEATDISRSMVRNLLFSLPISTEQSTILSSANALRLSGTLHLCEGSAIEATGAMNSPLVLPLKEKAFSQGDGELLISAVMSEGVASLNVMVNGTRILLW
jgi:predicted RNA methylase